MTTKQYSFPASLIFSFISIPFYQDVFRRWKGTGFLHIFYCTFLVCLLSYLFITSEVNKYKEQENIDILFNYITNTIADKEDFDAEEQMSRLLTILAQFPDMRIEKNQLVSSQKMPININDPYSLRYIITIDNSDNAKTSDHNESKLFFFKEAIAIKHPSGKDVTIPYESLHGGYQNMLNNFFYYASQLPEIHIKDERANIDKPTPYIIYKKDAVNVPFIVFDAAESALPQNPLYKEAAAIITQDQLLVRSRSHENEWISLPFSEISNENLYNNFSHTMPLLADYITAIFLPQNATQIFIVWLFLAIACALITSLATGFFAKSMLATPLDYNDTLRLTSIAITPVILLSPLFYLGKFFYPNLFLSPTASCLILCLLYSLFAILSLRSSTPHTAAPSE